MGGTSTFVGYADSNWAGDKDRKSTTGYLFEVYNATILWTTRKQSTVALSSTEAEYVALASALTEVIWLRNLLQELGIDTKKPTIVYEDNQSCIHLLTKWKHRRLKHIDVKYHFVRVLVNDRIIDVKYISSKEQKADMLTKGLSADQFVTRVAGR